MTSQTCHNEFDPLGDEGMDGDEYQSYHGCGIPGCDCSTIYGNDLDDPEDDYEDDD